jgi:FKBP-type peptidyl-prolyl cis-trans isomerase 2
MIADGKIVSIHYTLTLKDGEVIESNIKEEPLEYTLGSGELMSGLEEILAEMSEGEERTGILPPEKGYGLSLPEAFFEIPRSHLPPEAWEEGARLQGEGPNGERIDGVVARLKEKCAVVDFNHSLAGKSIGYTLKVLSIR